MFKLLLFIKNGKRFFALIRQSKLLKLQFEGILVNNFFNAMAQRIMHLKASPYYFIRFFFKKDISHNLNIHKFSNNSNNRIQKNQSQSSQATRP